MYTAGDVLGDRYRLDAPVARGGMGDVWRATDTVLGRGVAVKLLDVRHADDSGFRSRFRHEARAMAMLRHPGVADVFDYGETEDGRCAYIVMAYVDGEPLDRRIAERGRLAPGDVMSIVAQAARALHAAHVAGIVHRDVKPGNLVICPDGTAVLVDFGISHSGDLTAHTGVNEVIGTARYMAPEQVSKQAVGAAADLYALGAVAYHCLAGVPPFSGDNPLSVALSHLDDDPPPLPDDVPAAVRDVVTTAMAKKPGDRFPTAAAMAEAADAAGTPGAAPTQAAAADADLTVPVATAAAGGTTRRLPAAVADTAAGPAIPPGRDGRRARPKAWALAVAALATTGLLALAGVTLLSPDADGPPADSPLPGTVAVDPTPAPGDGAEEAGDGAARRSDPTGGAEQPDGRGETEPTPAAGDDPAEQTQPAPDATGDPGPGGAETEPAAPEPTPDGGDGTEPAEEPEDPSGDGGTGGGPDDGTGSGGGGGTGDETGDGPGPGDGTGGGDGDA